MSVRQAPGYQQAQPERPIDDDSDVEEEALANDYRQAASYNDQGENYDLERSDSLGSGPQDLQAQLAAAAQPREALGAYAHALDLDPGVPDAEHAREALRVLG